MNNTIFNSQFILDILNRYRKPLIIIGVVSALAGVVFSMPYFMPPRFKSNAIIYPSNLISYSSESPTEQMLQIAQSSDIRSRIINVFNLYSHYGIDTTTNPHFKTDAIAQYEENVTIKKTEYESMEITAYDEDPQMAAAIVDSIIYHFNIKAREMQRDKSMEVLVIAKNQMDMKKAEMDSMETVIKQIRNDHGILDYKGQSEEALRGLFRNLSSGNGNGVNEAKKMIESLKEKGGEYNALNEHLWRVRGNYNDLKIAYEVAYRDVNKILTYTNVVTKPQVADKKSFPVRWLIVLISVSSSLLFAFIVALIIEARKLNNSNENA
jgi:uncharacterized protein involved in exopolysaccharide biosynthesis